VSSGARLYVQAGFLDRDLLAAVHRECDGGIGMPAEVHSEALGHVAVRRGIRRTWELELSDALQDGLVAAVEAVRGAIEQFFAVRAEPCDALAALRYPPGAFYRTHRDVSAQPTPDGLHRRAISIVIFANSGTPAADASFSGGRLRLHDLPGAGGEVHDVVPVAGTLVAFDSSVLHEVTPVEGGTRLSLVTWLLRSEPA
jgi:predicted 2-oxoglutarate/Fe(II)-dependent dioxygenase YbiX